MCRIRNNVRFMNETCMLAQWNYAKLQTKHNTKGIVDVEPEPKLRKLGNIHVC